MADLIKRLYQVDETDPDWHETYNIAAQQFTAALWRVLFGAHTPANIKTFYDMDVDEQVTFDKFIAAVQTQPDTASRMMMIQQVQAILDLKEGADRMNNPAYDTLNDIRTQFTALIGS